MANKPGYVEFTDYFNELLNLIITDRLNQHALNITNCLRIWLDLGKFNSNNKRLYI